MIIRLHHLSHTVPPTEDVLGLLQISEERQLSTLSIANCLTFFSALQRFASMNRNTSIKYPCIIRISCKIYFNNIIPGAEVTRPFLFYLPSTWSCHDQCPLMHVAVSQLMSHLFHLGLRRLHRSHTFNQFLFTLARAYISYSSKLSSMSS
jgi:hypothetical protein